MRRATIWSTLLLIMVLVSCGGKKSHDHLSIDIKDIATEDSLWYLYTYGTHDITIDTISVSGKGRIDWDKALDLDTLDMLLLYDSEGLLQLPLLPSRTGNISAKISNNEVVLEGVQEVDSILSWYRAKEQGMEQLLSFLNQYQSNSIAFIMVSDAIQRDKGGECTEELVAIQSRLSNTYTDMVDLLGFSDIATGAADEQLVPYGFRIAGKEETKPFKELIGKRALMVINVMELTPEDSVAYMQQKKYLSRLDSLGLLSYNVLLNDELPKGIKKGANAHFLVDSIGYAVEYIRENHIHHVPIYMLVDSTRQVWRTWEVADSLVQFIKEYKNVGRRVD